MKKGLKNFDVEWRKKLAKAFFILAEASIEEYSGDSE